MEHWIWDRETDEIKSVDFMTWSRWYEKANRHLAKDKPCEGVMVSTVFLPGDHSLGDEDGPILWETMIFSDGVLPHLDESQWRYRSKEDALAGHANAMVEVEQAIRERERMQRTAERRG